MCKIENFQLKMLANNLKTQYFYPPRNSLLNFISKGKDHNLGNYKRVKYQ